MSHQRRAAVAGRFYLSDADLLRAAVSSMLDAVEVNEDEPLARAYVVPHAGHRFSGSVAAQVYARLRQMVKTMVDGLYALEGYPLI